MFITKRSPLSGVTRTMDLDVTTDQLRRWAEGELIQEVFPHLTADEREFLMTGISHDEWEDMFEADDGMSDVEADADTLRSAGMGTDEDYGHFGDDY